MDWWVISWGLLQALLHPLKPDVPRGPPRLSGGQAPLGPRNSTTASDYMQ